MSEQETRFTEVPEDILILFGKTGFFDNTCDLKIDITRMIGDVNVLLHKINVKGEEMDDEDNLLMSMFTAVTIYATNKLMVENPEFSDGIFESFIEMYDPNNQNQNSFEKVFGKFMLNHFVETEQYEKAGEVHKKIKD